MKLISNEKFGYNMNKLQESYNSLMHRKKPKAPGICIAKMIGGKDGGRIERIGSSNKIKTEG